MNRALLLGLAGTAAIGLGAAPAARAATPLSVDNAVIANWWQSFDREGWSTCPDQTFIIGFYKSSCNWIYCLESAKCARIGGSAVRGNTSIKSSWYTSFDYAGWSVLDNNRFMTGLYRSGSHYLYNIEYPNQSTALYNGRRVVWANCGSYRVDFNKNNRWFNCPDNTLLTGLYRGDQHYLSSILYYSCCQPALP